MKITSVYLPEIYKEALDYLVEKEQIKSRSEGIRIALRDYLKIEFLLNQQLMKNKHIQEQFPIENLKTIQQKYASQ